MVTWHKWVMAGNKPDGTPLYYGEGECLSTDVKLTDGVFNGSVLIEMDTSTVYFYDANGAEWIAFGGGDTP